MLSSWPKKLAQHCHQVHGRPISPSEETGNRYPDQNLNLEFEIESHIFNQSPASPPDSNERPTDNSTPSGGHVTDSGGDKRNDDVTEGMNTNEFREFEIAAGHHQTGEAGDNQTVKTPAEHNSTGTHDVIKFYHVTSSRLNRNCKLTFLIQLLYNRLTSMSKFLAFHQPIRNQTKLV